MANAAAPTPSGFSKLRHVFQKYQLDKGLGALSFGIDYMTDRKQGKSVMSSLASAGVSNAAYILWPGYGLLQIGAQFGTMGAAALLNNAKGNEYKRQTMANRGYIGGGYQDTQANATMRQAGMQSIANSYANVNTAFGNEARMYSG